MDNSNIALNANARPASRWLKRLIGYALAALCLVWVFHDIHAEKLLQNVAGINWWWVAPAIAFDILSYLCQGLRWQLLLRPVGELTVLRTTQAIYVGLFANEVLPMRFGELVRAYLASRWARAEFASIIPSMMVERLFDGVWLAVAIGMTAIFVPLPENMLEAGDILGVITLAATGLFLYLTFREKKSSASRPPEPLARWKLLRLAKSFLTRMNAGLRSIGLSRASYLAFGLSLLFMALQAMAFWLIMLACGLRLSLWIGCVVFLIVHLGTAIPNAPANVGTYQFFTVVGLSLFGIEKTEATAFSLIVFILLTLPLWAIGLFALGRTGMTLVSIRDEIRRLMARRPYVKAL